VRGSATALPLKEELYPPPTSREELLPPGAPPEGPPPEGKDGKGLPARHHLLFFPPEGVSAEPELGELEELKGSGPPLRLTGEGLWQSGKEGAELFPRGEFLGGLLTAF